MWLDTKKGGEEKERRNQTGERWEKRGMRDLREQDEQFLGNCNHNLT